MTLEEGIITKVFMTKSEYETLLIHHAAHVFPNAVNPSSFYEVAPAVVEGTGGIVIKFIAKREDLLQ